ncbi:hypothetical protein AgCh_030655 [Apium graveolens]
MTSSDITTLASLTPNSENKKVMIRVTRMWEAINKRKGMLLHMNVILRDQQENEVYTISDFKVVPGPKNYKTVDADYTINFYYKTKIEKVVESAINIPQYKFELRPFPDVENLVGNVAMLIECSFTSAKKADFVASTGEAVSELLISSILSTTIPPELQDHTGTTTVTLFNKEAEQIIGVPLQKKLAEEAVDTTTIPPVVNNIIGKHCAFQLKITPYNIIQGCEEYTVTHVSEIIQTSMAPASGGAATSPSTRSAKKQKVA